MGGGEVEEGHFLLKFFLFFFFFFLEKRLEDMVNISRAVKV